MAISRIRTCQRCKVLLPHFQLDRTAKDLKFCSCTSFSLTTNDVTWNLFHTSALPILRKMWSSASALPSCLGWQQYEVRFPYFRSVTTLKDLVHLPHLFCQDFQMWISPLPHFISAGLPKIWNSASTLLLCLDCQDVKFCFLSSAVRFYYAFPHRFVRLLRRVR